MPSMACITGKTRFFFLHVQKTAGKSMTQSFLRINSENSAKTMHDSARSFRQWWPDEYAAFPSFAVVRNPYDRWVSIYHHYHPEYPTFKKFLQDYKTWHPGWTVANQWWILSDGSDEEIIINYIGRFEALDKTWREFCRILGVAPFPLDQWKPPNVRPPWREFYCPETIRIATDLSQRDLETFGYRFDP